MLAKRTELKIYDLGNGFRIDARNMGNWTQYTAVQLRDDGFHVDGRYFTTCYRREADAKIAEWKNQDATWCADGKNQAPTCGGQQ